MERTSQEPRTPYQGITVDRDYRVHGESDDPRAVSSMRVNDVISEDRESLKEIPKFLNTLYTSTQELREQVAKLELMLSPALTHYPVPEDDSEYSYPEANTEHGSMLLSILQQVKLASETVKDLQGRLEI